MRIGLLAVILSLFVAQHAAARTTECGLLRGEMHSLRTALVVYEMTHGVRAPNLEVLVKERLLDTSSLQDPWGQPYVVEFSATEPKILTLGPDGIGNTPDDYALGGGPCPKWGTSGWGVSDFAFCPGTILTLLAAALALATLLVVRRKRRVRASLSTPA